MRRPSGMGAIKSTQHPFGDGDSVSDSAPSGICRYGFGYDGGIFMRGDRLLRRPERKRELRSAMLRWAQVDCRW